MTFPIATTDDLLRVWRDGMSRDYSTGIEFVDEGRAWDAIVGQAAIFARVSEAVGITTQAYYLRPHSTQIAPQAGAAQYARGPVTIVRRVPANGPVTLDAGSRIVAYVHDVTGELIAASTYELEAEVVFAPGELGPVTVDASAVRVGYQGNIPDGRIVAFALAGRLSVPGTVTAANTVTDTPGVADRFIPGLVGRYVRFVGGGNFATYPRRVVAVTIASNQATTANEIEVDGPALTLGAQTTELEELVDLGLEIEMSGAFVDGRHGWLDAIGEERDCYRQNGETDPDYLARIITLDDVVSPGAITRLAERVLTTAGIPWRLIEAGDPIVLSAFLWDPSIPGTGAGEFVTIDFSTRTRMFAIALGLNGEGEDGTHLDVCLGATDENDLDDQGIFDGGPLGWLASLAALRSQLERIRAAGVAAYILIDPIYF